MAESDLKIQQVRLSKADQQVKAKERAFGVNERAQLDRLLKDQYAEMVMNARALKIRMRQRLISRKFEWDRVERSYREQMSGKCKFHYVLISLACRFREKTLCSY